MHSGSTATRQGCKAINAFKVLLNMDTKPNVLFLCTGNSCRSQMAEGFLRELSSDRFSAYSAGTDPAESVHPLAVTVMAEKGIDISQQQPTNVSNYLGRLAVRHLIIVCAGAMNAVRESSREY